jgi:hypothetical protein
MRTTIDLPEDLILEAMRVTHIKTKTDVIKEGLSALIRRENIKNLKKYKGTVDLDIDLDSIRKR